MIICLPQIVLIDKEHGIPVVAFVFLWIFIFFCMTLLTQCLEIFISLGIIGKSLSCNVLLLQREIISSACFYP